tara:strand:- start:853 stop:1029 length:177 start_codon:yes stop_codon:yes gene_type:complete
MDSFFHEMTGQKLTLDENGSSANHTPDALFPMAQLKVCVIFDGWSLARKPSSHQDGRV